MEDSRIFFVVEFIGPNGNTGEKYDMCSYHMKHAIWPTPIYVMYIICCFPSVSGSKASIQSFLLCIACCCTWPVVVILMILFVLLFPVVTL